MLENSFLHNLDVSHPGPTYLLSYSFSIHPSFLKIHGLNITQQYHRRHKDTKITASVWVFYSAARGWCCLGINQAVARYISVVPGNQDAVKSHWCKAQVPYIRTRRLFSQLSETPFISCFWQYVPVPSLLQLEGKWWSFKTDLCRVSLHASLKHKIQCTSTLFLCFFPCT